MSDVSMATQKRLLIWATPRSLSTVLMRALSGSPNSLVLMENFLTPAWNLVPDFLTQDDGEMTMHSREPDDVTFQSVKELYEQPHSDKSLVLGKEMASFLDDNMSMIPRGYTHIFLLRHPAKTISSVKKQMSFASPESRAFLLRINQHRSLAKTYEFVTQHRRHETAVVVDADDLTTRPAKALQLLCAATGLPFSPGMLKWEPITDGVPSNWLMPKSLKTHENAMNFFTNAFTSRCFQVQKKDPNNPAAQTEQVDTEIQELIQKALPYYEDLYRHRLIVE